MIKAPDYEAEAARAVGRSESGADIRVLGEGQFCVAVSVGNDLVLRFPKHEAGVRCLRAERAIVPLLHGRVNVALPEPERANLDLPIGEAFAAHRLVPGEVMTTASLNGLHSSDQAEVVEQLADLLNVLAVLGEPALAAGVAARTLSDIGADMKEQFGRLLKDRMTNAQRSRAIAEIARFSAIAGDGGSLCHTDLGGNMVWDAKRRRVGLLDLGTSIVSDPVLDLASLFTLGDDFAVLVGQGTSHLGQRVKNVPAIRSTFALQHALNSARQDDWSSVETVLADY